MSWLKYRTVVAFQEEEIKEDTEVKTEEEEPKPKPRRKKKKQTGRWSHLAQGSHRLEKYLNLEGFLEKSLKIKSFLKSTGKSLKGLEKSLNSSIFCKT